MKAHLDLTGAQLTFGLNDKKLTDSWFQVVTGDWSDFPRFKEPKDQPEPLPVASRSRSRRSRRSRTPSAGHKVSCRADGTLWWPKNHGVFPFFLCFLLCKVWFDDFDVICHPKNRSNLTKFYLFLGCYTKLFRLYRLAKGSSPGTSHADDSIFVESPMVVGIESPTSWW